MAPVLLQHRGGGGPPLVLLHGLGLTWRSWLPVLAALEAHHDVLAFDLPGFGASAPLPDGEAPTPQRLAEAIAHDLDELGIETAAIAGNSLGGWVALELARLGRAERVVALSPAGLETPPERAAVIALNELMRARARVAAPLGRLATTPLPGRVALFGILRSRPWRMPPDEGARELQSFGRSRSFHAALAASIGTSVPSGLGEIKVPVRVAYGTRDLLLGWLTSPRFALLIPDASLVPLTGVGHVPMVDDPGLVASAILGMTRPPADGGAAL